MGDPLDFIDEGGWPYPDEELDLRPAEPVDLRSQPDDDAIALHALTPRALVALDDLERAALTRRFGLDGRPPMSMVDLQESLGLSRDRTRAALGGGLTKLRTLFGTTPA